WHCFFTGVRVDRGPESILLHPCNLDKAVPSTEHYPADRELQRIPNSPVGRYTVSYGSEHCSSRHRRKLTAEGGTLPELVGQGRIQAGSTGGVSIRPELFPHRLSEPDRGFAVPAGHPQQSRVPIDCQPEPDLSTTAGHLRAWPFRRFAG